MSWSVLANLLGTTEDHTHDEPGFRLKICLAPWRVLFGLLMFISSGTAGEASGRPSDVFSHILSSRRFYLTRLPPQE